MLWFQPGDTLSKEFPTSHPANGQSVDADSTPVVVLVRNGVADTEVDVEVTPIETGRYLASCVIPDGYSPGDLVTLRVTVIVAGVTARGTLTSERLIGINLTQEIATKLFVDGTANKLKVNSDHSVNSDVTIGPDEAATIAAAINGYTATQLAAALTGVTSVFLVGPLMTGETHKMVRGSAYLHSLGTAPFVRIAKALFNLEGATATFRMKLDGNSRISVSATIISFDSNYYEIYADLNPLNSASNAVGTGHDQFWVTLAGGQTVCLSQTYLEIIEGISA